jgi:hypothetical protein
MAGRIVAERGFKARRARLGVREGCIGLGLHRSGLGHVLPLFCCFAAMRGACSAHLGVK